MDKVIESFINQCDEMMIAEEGLLSNIKEKQSAKKELKMQETNRKIKLVDELFAKGSVIVNEMANKCISYTKSLKVKELSPKIDNINKIEDELDISIILSTDNKFTQTSEFEDLYHKIQSYLKSTYEKEILEYRILFDGHVGDGEIIIAVARPPVWAQK